MTVDQAKKAATVFGGPTFLWDNYPVNDYGQTSGRLLLAPYDKREAGLGEYLSGIVSNPMNQAAASKIAIFGVADFTWNDEAYDAERNWSQAFRVHRRRGCRDGRRTARLRRPQPPRAELRGAVAAAVA